MINEVVNDNGIKFQSNVFVKSALNSKCALHAFPKRAPFEIKIHYFLFHFDPISIKEKNYMLIIC
jgi:hypothetical protein